MKRTPAEDQMEELKRLRESLAKRKPLATPKIRPASDDAPGRSLSPGPFHPLQGGFELAEAPKTKKMAQPALPISRALYRQILEAQRQQRSFKRRADMGDWAAELLLALPLDAHKLSNEAKKELFQRMQEWGRARGLT